MRLTRVLEQTNRLTLDSLRKTIAQLVDDAPSYLKGVKEQQKGIVYGKLSMLNKFYMKIIGLDEVKLHHGKVTALQDQLYSIQERRRVIGRQLIDVKDKSDKLFEEIRNTSRLNDTEKFLDLLEQETEVLKMEKSLYQVFQDYDQTERDIFVAFVNAVRNSHEKQKVQSEYTKYFGIILGIVGSFLTFVYSTIKKQDLKCFVGEKLDSIHSGISNIQDTLDPRGRQRILEFFATPKRFSSTGPETSQIVEQYVAAGAVIGGLSVGLIMMIMACCAR